MKRNNFLSIAFLLSIMAITNLSCSKDVDTTPATNSISLTSSSTFTPPSLTVTLGTTIIWTNNDAATHTVTSDSGIELNSGDMVGGAIYTHKFNTAGTYPYYCKYHGAAGGIGMAGVVIVTP